MTTFTHIDTHNFTHTTITIEEIKKEMRSKLPSYMIPKKVFFVKYLPLNSNGKLDRNECLKLAQTLYGS